MEYETKKWVVRWTGHYDYRLNHPTTLSYYRNYDRQYKNPFAALRQYRKLVQKDVMSAVLIRIDVKNNEYIVDSMDKAVPVTYSEA